MEPLGFVDVAGLVSWIQGISFEDWPQQRRGELRPAMVTDAHWRGFGAKATPIVHDLMAHFPGKTSHQWMLSAVMPGHEIPPHRDEQPPHWITRVHVPLLTNAQSFFILGGISFAMDVGEAYQVNTRLEHSVINNGPTPRVHFMFDVHAERGRA